LQPVRRLGIRRALTIVLPTIIENEHRILDKLLGRKVQVLVVLFLHRAQVHGLLDHRVVILDFVFIDGLLERPRGAVVLHVVKEVEECVVVWTVARLARELVHVRGPAGFFDCGDAQGVNLAKWLPGLVARPFFGRLVNVVGF